MDSSYLASLSPASLAAVQAYADEKAKPTTPTQFAINILTYWFALYLLAAGTTFALNYVRRYRVMDHEKKRTTTIYVLNICITAIALILQLAASPVLGSQITMSRIDCIRAAAILICGLYPFELTHRVKMRWPMIIHHFLTLFAIILTCVMLERTQDPSFLSTAIVWLFQATTEQTTFVSLIMYRLRFRPDIVTKWLYFSAVQTLACKFASSIYLFVWLGLKQRQDTSQLGLAWSAILVIAVIALAFTQIWGSYVLYVMGKTMQKRYNDAEAVTGTASPDDIFSTPQSTRVNSPAGEMHMDLDKDILEEKSDDIVTTVVSLQA